MIEANYTQQQPNSYIQESITDTQTNAEVSQNMVFNLRQDDSRSKFFKVLILVVVILILAVGIGTAFRVLQGKTTNKSVPSNLVASSSENLTTPTEELQFARNEATKIFLAAEMYKQSEKGNGKYPATINLLKEAQLIEDVTLPQSVSYTYAATNEGADCKLQFIFSNGKQTTNTCSNATNLEAQDGVFEKTAQEIQADQQVDKKLPYVAAARDVEMVFSAVSRFRAFNNTNPENLQTLIDSGELLSTFPTKERKGYSIEYSAVTKENAQIIVRFENGQIITAKYDDPSWHEQFVENYPNK
jgi:hypothetical protein